MPRIPRKHLVEAAEVGIYYCIQRCVRGAILFGRDDANGKNYNHRRIWLHERLEFLAGHFGVDVLAFAVLNNALHLILRNRPDVAHQWTDKEIARRWWNLFKKREAGELLPEPTKSELVAATADAPRLAEFRERLASISWFMRSLVEPIARRANREDQCSGHFWEGRYECQPILDEPALAACMAHVDLNPICAGLARTPATSPSSAVERIKAFGAAMKAGTPGKAGAAAGARRRGKTRQEASDARNGGQRPADWLSPICLTRTSAEAASHGSVPKGRASDTGCLTMSLEDYVTLLNWTGRQLRSNECGPFPRKLATVMTDLRVNEENWLRLVREFSAVFRRCAGTPESLKLDAEKRGTQRREGIAQSVSVFNPIDDGAPRKPTRRRLSQT